MCPFFDDIEKLTNFKYTLPCVTRIGMEVSFLFLYFFTLMYQQSLISITILTSFYSIFYYFGLTSSYIDILQSYYLFVD
jgi:hypothetical protein